MWNGNGRNDLAAEISIGVRTFLTETLLTRNAIKKNSLAAMMCQCALEKL